MQRIELTHYRDSAGEAIAGLQADLAARGIDLHLHRAPPGAPVTIELTTPALVVIAFAQTFLAALVGELAKDAYDWLKQRLGTFAREAAAQQPPREGVMGGDAPPLALEAEAGDALIRLLFPAHDPAFAYEAAAAAFLEFAVACRAGRATLDDLGPGAAEHPDGVLRVRYDAAAGRLAWVDPVAPALRRP
ncbi:hypothetical protein CYR32_09860 [Chimaeribacter coloradensis]|uniref:Uncharacterized protein n=1 Tax=Chimaeribacter coloradensis TaxID=2060068 RepID=A0A2N5E4X9_9GAMM|nr:hypothetical protein [Chimaeribacter coloradensis]PLR36050.1 hypothetical protein CYR32_09860 [Chimaeribacter coloradensis]